MPQSRQPSHQHPHQRPTTGFRPDVVPTPRIIFWETTGACNLRCVHCRRSWTDTAPNELTTHERKLLLIDSIAKANWNSILVFSGGEPLMRNDIFELIAHCRPRNVTPAVATNATLITRDIAQRLAQLDVSRVSVSLDGADAFTHDSFRAVDGSFHQAILGIRALREANIDVQINVTFTNKNRHHASAMLDLVKQLDACALHVFLLVPVGCGVNLPDDVRLSSSEVERLLTYFDNQASERDLEIRATCAPQAQRIRAQQARIRAAKGLEQGRGLAASSKGCLAGGGILFVDATGKVFPCGYMPIGVGNIRTHKLAEIVERSEVLTNLRDVSKLQGRCSACAWVNHCGGCRARALATYHDLFAQEPSCPMNPQIQEG